MVRTLIKHEALRTGRRVLMLFGGATLFAAVGTLMMVSGVLVFFPLGALLAGAATIALTPVVMLVLGLDYYRSSYREFGYFTQTIPVRGSTIYWSKLAWAFVVTLAAVVWSLPSALITWAGVSKAQGWPFSRAFDVIQAAFAMLQDALSWWHWPLAVLALLLVLCVWLLQYFFAASIGSERRIRDMGFVGVVLVWFGAYVAMQILNFVGILLVPVSFGAVDGGLGFTRLDSAQMLFSDTQNDAMPIGYLVSMLVAAALMCWRTVISWNRKVHLS